VLGWRKVPVDPRSLGSRARESMPEIWQFFVEAEKPDQDIERQLALLRKRAESDSSATRLYLFAVL